MIVNNYITEEIAIEIKVCNICELPIINEEVADNTDICEDCFWNLDIHNPNCYETSISTKCFLTSNAK